jgi:hypothetical protein
MRAATSWLATAAWLAVGPGGCAGPEAVRLQERFGVGYQYQVRTRVDLSGTLQVPAARGKPAPKPLTLRGFSAIEYDERVLSLSKIGVSKTVRLNRRMDFHRTVGGRVQETALRREVRRLVLLRRGSTEVPFSPDGPLTWGEIDLVRTDVFTPALTGLLPDRPVRVGERWQARVEAVRELTDMERLEGFLECRLERVFVEEGRRQARVAFSGTVRGVSEDGPNRQRLQGHFLFDLGGNYLSYLYLSGRHEMLDTEGRVAGRVEGRFVLTRRANTHSAELSDAALRGVALEPSADNTRLLYDNPDLGVRFLYPRRWKVAGVRGSQLALDGADGCGLLLTIDPLSRVPSGASFLAESRTWLVKQKARLLRVVPPASVPGTRGLEHFALEAEMGGQKFWMDYYVTRHAGGGATLAARLPPRDLAAMRKEVAQLARSVVITRKIEAPRAEGRR